VKIEKENLGSRLGRWILIHRLPVLLISFAAVALFSYGMASLTLSTDMRVFFGPNNPQLKALEKLEDVYSKDNSVLLAIAPKNGDVFTSGTLSLVSEITELFWQLPYSNRVDSLSNYQHTWAEGDELIVRNLVENPETLGDMELDAIREIAVNEPALRNRLVSENGRATGIVVLFHMPEDKGEGVTEVVDKVREILARVESAHPEIEFHLVGGVMVDKTFAEASEADMKSLIPAMYILMFAFMWITLRSLAGTMATIMVIIVSSATAMGIAGWGGMVLNSASVNAPIVILTLSVADSVHILATMFQEMRRGKSREEALVESLRINLQPVFLTSLTTAIGFLSMNFSDAPPFADLGNIVAVGVASAFIYSVTFLPALMLMVPLRQKAVPNPESWIIDRFSDFVVLYKNSLLWGMSLVILIFLAGIPRIEINDLYTQYFDERFRFRVDVDWVEKNLTGISSFEYSFESGEEGGIADPEYLETLDRFAKWLKQQPEVTQVTGIHDILKRLNKSMHGDDPEWYRVPDRKDLAAQYLLLYEMSLPFGLDLNRMINIDKSASRFTVSLVNVLEKEMRDFEKKATGWIRENGPERMHAEATGISLTFAHITERTIRSMFKGTAVALLLISAVLVISLRDVRLGLLSILPNVVPSMMAFGLWGYTVSRVGLAASVITALSLGIVVDDTVHFLSKYLRARREHRMSPEEAVRYSFHTVGRALVFTSVILVAGFGILNFSGFSVNATLGLLTAIAIAFALLVDFLFLPALLMRFDRAGNKQGFLR
jgi:hypothetical protein